ncbi:hypothetical protein FRB96_004792 [Tulasnella sp. 330]|nr:hypothetical protein FRB96_004792 [Tulasnella sp. 330]
MLLVSKKHGCHARLTSASVKIKEIVVDAVSHSIEMGWVQGAVEILEQGKGLMFNQFGTYRTSLDDLEVANKDLADRFRKLNVAMEQSTLSHEADPKRVFNGEDEIALSRRS